MVGQAEDTSGPRRYAVVGLGARAELYTRALGGESADRAELAAFCPTNRTRMAVHNATLARERGHAPVPTYAASEFAAMLARERIDVVVVCTTDSTHDSLASSPK